VPDRARGPDRQGGGAHHRNHPPAVAQLPGELAALLPPTSSTVHRLLGVLPDGGFRHHAGNPLPIDVLIVDEASMLDLALAARLFEAVPPAARIILVGDKDQLAAVESGAVFAELSADPTLSAERIALLHASAGSNPLPSRLRGRPVRRGSPTRSSGSGRTIASAAAPPSAGSPRRSTPAMRTPL